MAKKIKGPVTLNLYSEQADSKHPERKLFCRVWEHDKKDCAFGIPVVTDADHYNLLYQNGQFLGILQPRGGVIYPFSRNPYKKGSRFGNRKIYRAKVVCISSAETLKMRWGTFNPILIYDKEFNPYYFGANGSLFLEIDPGDAARNADCMYRKLLASADEEGMTVGAVDNVLREAFVVLIEEKVQEVLEELDRPLGKLVGLQPKEKLEISCRVYDKLKNVFGDFGLTLLPVSKNSILSHLVVREDSKKSEPAVQTAPKSRFTPAMW